MREWLPINETTPRDRVVPILLWFAWFTPNPAALGARGTMAIGLWGYPMDDDDQPRPCWVSEEGERLGGEPTHWMPLPEAPR